MTRQTDLEKAIRESYTIIRDYEAIIRTSDRPEEKQRARRIIAEQWALVQDALAEYRLLVKDRLPDEIAQIAARFTALEELGKVEQGIEMQDNLRGILPDDQIETTLTALQSKRQSIHAQLWGGGIVAQGGSAVNTGSGLAVAGNVGNISVHYHGEQSPATGDLRQRYLHHLFETVSRMALSGIDPKAASDAEARLNLGAVYTALLTLTPQECDQVRRGEWAGGDCPPGMAREGARRLSALAQLDQHSRLVLLGDPGSGKSTFVNFVAICMAGELLRRPEANLERLREPLPPQDGERQDQDKKPEPQPWRHGALLPVRVILRDLAARGLPPPGGKVTAQHLWQFIVDELRAAALDDFAKPLGRELWETGGLLLLDGLDEVPVTGELAHRREQIKQVVDAFAASFPKCRILVTSRTYAYQQQQWRLPGFEETVLAPFGQGQIDRFVKRWYAHIGALRQMHEADIQWRAGLLKRAIRGSDRLRGLAQRPLLLTLMASLHAWRGGSLPEKREELYNDTVDLLLDWWEGAKTVDGMPQPSLSEWLKVDRDRVRGLLDELAYRAHTGQPTTVGTADIPEGDLLSGLMRLSQNPEVEANPALLVHYLSQRAGLLLPRGVGVYTFPHRTFQEYLAACYLTDHDYPDLIADLARNAPDRWREVALLAGAKSARGSDYALWALVETLCDHDLAPGEAQTAADAWGALLAGQALTESAVLDKIGKRDLPKRDRVRRHLVRLIEAGELPAVERVLAGDLLATLGDPRPGVGLIAPSPARREREPEGEGLPDLVWCEVPAGPFLMGDDDLSVSLPAFYISRYPITQAQFAAFVQTGGYADPRYWPEAKAAGRWQGGQFKGRWDDGPRSRPVEYGSPFSLPNHPVVGVSWYESLAFCRWLEERLKTANGELHDAQGNVLAICHSQCAIRLPSEAEWEKAASWDVGANPGGRPRKRRYPWGDEPDPDRANYGDTGIGTTSAVGCFPGGASPYGVLDLSGNVWEWCSSLYKSDPYRADDGREDLNEARHNAGVRVLRGGAFNNYNKPVRCAYRIRDYPDNRNYDGGFRLVVVSPSFRSGL